jgi:hypothetical protein
MLRDFLKSGKLQQLSTQFAENNRKISKSLWGNFHKEKNQERKRASLGFQREIPEKEASRHKEKQQNLWGTWHKEKNSKDKFARPFAEQKGLKSETKEGKRNKIK